MNEVDMKELERMEIAIAGDANYIVPLTVLLKSIFIHNTDVHITINFLHLVNAIDESGLAEIEQLVVTSGHTMRRLPVTEAQLGEVPESRHSKSTYLRLFLPELLPEEVTRVLYLDGDIVVNGAIKPLYDTDLSASYIAGVKDTTIIFGKEHYCALDIPQETEYFNAGVVLMNIARMRKENMQAAFFEYLRTHIHLLKFSDQDVLNGTLYRAVTCIPPKYNYNYWTEKDIALQLYSKEEWYAAIHHPVIVHYIGPVKPWHYKSIHPKKSLWWHYLKQTAYKDYRPKDKTLKNMVSYFFLRTIVKPIKPLLTVEVKQKMGRLLPAGIKRVIKRGLFKAQ